MLRQICITFLFMVMSSSAAVAADCTPPISPVPNLPSVHRGETVTVKDTCLPTGGAKVFLRTGKETDKDKGLPLDANVAQKARVSAFKFQRIS